LKPHNKFFSTGNRPVVAHRLFCLMVFLLFLFLSGFGFRPADIRNHPESQVVTSTPTPDETIKVPDSGEPIIVAPGNDSRLVSPIHLKFATRPGEDGQIRVDLIGQDNRLIYRSIRDYSSYIDHTILIEQEIPFEVRADESARLQIILENAKGKPIFVTSVDVTLLLIKGTETTGEAPVNPRLVIEQPVPGKTVTGSDLVIKGKIKPYNDTPLVFEVLGSDWHTLISKMITVSIPADRTAFSSFELKLPCKTGSDTPVTIRIHQESKSMITGTVFLWSEKVILNP
jgi:hypothetical protein